MSIQWHLPTNSNVPMTQASVQLYWAAQIGIIRAYEISGPLGSTVLVAEEYIKVGGGIVSVY